MNRREFIKVGGGYLSAGATLGLGAGLSSKSFAGTTRKPIGIAVIGAGSRGQHHFRFLEHVPQFKLVAFCDVLPFRRQLAQTKAPDAKAYSDHKRLLEDKNVEAVIIATHFSAHAEVMRDALDAGKHVYCEKVMVKGLAETTEAYRHIQSHPNLVVQTGFQFRTSPLYLAAEKLISSGAIGDISAIECQWNRNGSWRRPVPDPKWERQVNWRMYREYSGGLVAELSSHQMGFCDWVLGGDIDTVQGSGGINYWKDGRETYDNTHISMRYKSGTTAKFTCLTTNSLNGYRISVLGKKGSMILTNYQGWLIPEGGSVPAAASGVDLVSGASMQMQSADGKSDYVKSAANLTRKIDAPESDPTPIALRHFADSIVTKKRPAADAASGAKLSAIVQVSLDAMDSQQTIQWDSKYNFGA